MWSIMLDKINWILWRMVKPFITDKLEEEILIIKF